MNHRAHTRSAIYAGLSLYFSYPSERWVAMARAGWLCRACERLNPGPQSARRDGALTRWMRLLETEVARAEADQFLQFQVEYNRLFVGPFPPQIYPYESIFLHQEPFSASRAATTLLQIYRREGLMLAAECRDLPDHVAVELEFMGVLCHREAVAEEHHHSALAGEYRRQQRAFFRDHVVNWMPELIAEVERATRCDVYRWLARATGAFLRWESNQMAQSVSAEERRSLCQDDADGGR